MGGCGTGTRLFSSFTVMMLITSFVWLPQTNFRMTSLYPSGEFTVKSAYNLVAGTHSPKHLSPWNRWWTQKLPQRLLFFGWKIGTSILPTKEKLKKKRIIDNDFCELCHCHSESLPHIFKDCQSSVVLCSSCTN